MSSDTSPLRRGAYLDVATKPAAGNQTDLAQPYAMLNGQAHLHDKARKAYLPVMIDELYSARILSLAANLPHSGRLPAARLVDRSGAGERVAKLCGSRAAVDVVLDAGGRVVDFAQDVQACALGQAAAGVLGQAVIGATVDEIADARDAMLSMLKSGGEGPPGRFEGLRALKLVSGYPARHASTMVAIEATLDAARQAQERGARTEDQAARTRCAGAA